MIDREYVVSVLAWGVMIGCAVVVAFLIVPISRRRRVTITTLFFTIPLSMLGFVDGVSTQLGLVACSGGVVFMAIFFLVLFLMIDSLVLSKTSSADSPNQTAEKP